MTFHKGGVVSPGKTIRVGEGFTVLPFRKESTEELVHRIADKLAPQIRRTFLQAIEALKEQVPVNQITELLEAGNLTAVLEALQGTADLTPIRQAIQDAVEQVAAPTAIGFGLTFDAVNERAIRWAREHSGRLITQVSNETQTAVADIISRSLREGTEPRRQARLIREIVGLTRRDAGAVDRFLQGAVDSGMLRTRAEQQAERMARRLLSRRATNIARSETIRAANMGSQLAWEAAQDAGLLPPQTFKVWIATEDSRTCPICAVLDGNVVRLGDSFNIEEEATSFDIDGSTITVAGTRPLRRPTTELQPPAHPACRCSTGIVTQPT